MLRTFVYLLLTAACCAQQVPAPAALDLVKQGEKLNSEGKQDDALALYRQAIEISPNLYEAHLESGIALDLKGNYAEARQYLAKAIEVAPAASKQQALRAMAMSYSFEGNATEAAKFEQQVFDARLSTHDFIGAAEIANELARIYLESGDTANAYKWYESGYETAQHKPDLTEADKN
jgi:tetratricopeptide (TPR) repeat protein